MPDITTITDIAEARQGDWIVAEYNGHRYEGEAWVSSGHLWLGTDVVRYSDGTTPGQPEFIEARRPKPSLPTEPSLIRGTVRGRRVVMFGPDDDGDWHYLDDDGSCRWHSPDLIDVDDYEVLWSDA